MTVVKQTISEYLSDLDAHEIYASDEIGTDFLKHTGTYPCWKGTSAAVMRERIKARGLGGELEGDMDMISGYEMAEACAMKFANFKPVAMGRGSLFRECIRVLKQKGF